MSTTIHFDTLDGKTGELPLDRNDLTLREQQDALKKHLKQTLGYKMDEIVLLQQEIYRINYSTENANTHFIELVCFFLC